MLCCSKEQAQGSLSISPWLCDSKSSDIIISQLNFVYVGGIWWYPLNPHFTWISSNLIQCINTANRLSEEDRISFNEIFSDWVVCVMLGMQ